ncbi:hypothetical protein B0H65DRAFT_279858 [Neurospora tetraspora]|uniref:Protein kinase domain-containing protein n=1 Tax=Neurospora tetraspora TaxID=94610 RepID=A0AAE0JBU7_9PEZI|nr:hypothetical protein B0H65DRAFT_279858 [Neurospora tetraspora]
MDRSGEELYQKYLEASNEMYFPPESEDLPKPVTQAYDMWSMGVLMLDVLVWGLYGGKNLGIDEVFGEMGTQRPPSPLNTDSVSPKVFKRTKVNAEPSNTKLYEPFCPSELDADANADAPSPSTPRSSGSHETAVEMRLKLTILDRNFPHPRGSRRCPACQTVV